MLLFSNAVSSWGLRKKFQSKLRYAWIIYHDLLSDFKTELYLKYYRGYSRMKNLWYHNKLYFNDLFIMLIYMLNIHKKISKMCKIILDHYWSTQWQYARCIHESLYNIVFLFWLFETNCIVIKIVWTEILIARGHILTRSPIALSRIIL